MMVGTVVRMVVMMSSTEAHKLFGLFTKQVDLYLTGDLRVKRIMTEPGNRELRPLLPRSPLTLPAGGGRASPSKSRGRRC
jgi:hypothetical protein